MSTNGGEAVGHLGHRVERLRQNGRGANVVVMMHQSQITLSVALQTLQEGAGVSRRSPVGVRQSEVDQGQLRLAVFSLREKMRKKGE